MPANNLADRFGRDSSSELPAHNFNDACLSCLLRASLSVALGKAKHHKQTDHCEGYGELSDGAQ